MKWQRGTRRMFLRGAGGATLAIPFLSSLLPVREARAAGAAPRRFIAIKSYSAQKITDWYPTFTGNGYQLKDTVFPSLLPGDRSDLKEADNYRKDGTTHLTQALVPGKPYTSAPLTDFKAPSVSKLIGPDFNRHLERMLLIRGLDYLPDTNHNEGGMLGNFKASDSSAAKELPAWPTIDQVMAYSAKVYPTTPPLRSLHLSPGGTNSVSFSDNGKRGGPVSQVPARLDPLVAYRDAFMGFQPPTGDGGGGLVGPKLRSVDRVLEDYKGLRGNARLSAADRELLDSHVSFLSELQAKLAGSTSQPSQTCRAPALPPSIANDPPSGNLTDAESIKKTFELMIDILVAAVMCDRTRIVTLDLRKILGIQGSSLVGYHHFKATPGSWHGYAHEWGNASSDAIIFNINTWIAKNIVLRVVEKLDTIEADGRSYLDNSIVYWGNELGFNHIGLSIPALLFGSGGGYLKTGRYLDYTEWQSKLYFGQQGGCVIRGIPYNQFLVTMLQAMGLEPADYERAGQPGFAETKIVGKMAGAFPYDYDMSQIGQPLPGIR